MAMRDPLNPPPTGRNPDTVYLFALCLFAGVSQAASGTQPGTVDALVPEWLALAWAAVLIGGAVLVLVGVAWRQRSTGVLIELIGRVMFGPVALAYAAALVTGVDPWLTGVLAAAPFIGLGLSCGWRARQIVRTSQLRLRFLRARR